MEQEDTRTRILNAARREFLSFGFGGSSLRRIAGNAGVTTGAFYGYFKSKTQVFDALVEDTYETILSSYRRVLTEFDALPADRQQTDMDFYTAREVRKLTDFVYSRLPEFKLILCASEGTRYDHLIGDLAGLDVEATHSFKKQMEDMGLPMKTVNPMLEHMLTSGMFSAFFELVIHDVPRDQAEGYITQLLEFYSAGWQKIMGF